MTVLVVTSREHADPCVPQVIAGLEGRGARVVWLDTAAYPSQWQVTVAAGDREAVTIVGPHGAVEATALQAVWIRFPSPDDPLDALDPAWREAVGTQSELAVWEALDALDAFTVDAPARMRALPGKVGVLRLARAAGLPVPRTRLTNDPDEARALLATCQYGIIAKLLDNNALQIEDESGARQVFTMAFGPEDAAELDRLGLCPMIVQERVPKRCEVRVTAIGRRLFTAASEADESGPVDLAANATVVAGFRPFDLPPEIEAGVQRLLDRMQLEFATVDFLVTPDGAWRFLEVNTTSHYDFVERSAGLPITDALIDLLLGGGARRTG